MLLFAAGPALAQFTAINTPFAETPYPCVAWGDYDGDGDLDVLVAGEGSQGATNSTIFRNTAGSFASSGVALLGLEMAKAAWGDFDNDGDLDLAMTGLTNGGAVTTRVYRNNGATFAVVTGPFVNVYAGRVAWVDYDGDGDLDLFITGETSTVPLLSVPRVRLYRNDAGAFTVAAHPFGDLGNSMSVWVDYDNDGDRDLLLPGSSVAGEGCPLWRNDGGSFVRVASNLPDAGIGFAEWGDFDSDGDLDLLLGGDSDDGWISRVYRNDAGTMVDIGASLPGLIWSAAKWGDYDNDGDLDFVLMGYDPAEGFSRANVYRNDAGTFIDSGFAVHEGWLGLANWADYDNDGDLDLLVAGNSEGGDHLTFYRNNAIAVNTAPTAPGGLVAQVEGTSVVLAWGAGSDGQTLAPGLSYNVRVGTTAEGNEVLASQSGNTGFRRVPESGNAWLARVARLRGLTPGVTYYWSVQSVDASLVGSPFAAGGTFTASVDAPQNVALVRETGGAIRVTWRGTPGATYRVDVSPELQGWTTVASLVAAAGTGLFEFLETPPPDTPQRFYRAARP